MASTSETGHAINVANLEDLISITTGFGAKYNPSKANIKVTALTTLYTTAQAALNTHIAAENAFDKATNARRDAFKPLKPLATRIVNALDATDATANTVADAKGLNKKIQGTRDTPLNSETANPTTDPTNAPSGSSTNANLKKISTSQQSYDRLIDHTAKLIDLLKNEPAYVPNENELKVTSLQTQLTTLKTTNTNVIKAYTPFINAINDRNTILYAPNTGLLDVVGDVKKYVKSVFGATSPQYKQVTALTFTRVKK